MTEPDFDADERRLLEETIPAIAEFAAEHADEVFRYFAFDCNPDYGEVLFSLDTEANSAAEAKKHELYVTSQRHEKLDYNDSVWLPWAISTIENPVTGPVLPFNNNSGDFDHQGFAGVSFPDWEDLVSSDDFPVDFEESHQDYLTCKATVLLSRVIDALVECDAFSCLNRTSPFLVGFGFHDGPQVVIRMINW